MDRYCDDVDRSALDGLDPEQREAASVVRGPLVVLAGAGTGKTRTITHRIAHQVRTGVVPAEHLLAVTFTARAAGELRSRLRVLQVPGVQARTFHSAAMRMLSYFWPHTIGGRMPDLVDNKARLVASAATRAGLRPTTALVRDLASELEWAKSCLVTPDGYVAAALQRRPPAEPAAVAAVYEAYEQAKRSAGMLDFEDTLALTAGLVEDDRQTAHEVRSRYRAFVVDEYQDVNPLQQRLLEAWLGDRDDLCVVGDAQQTIYSFTGASPDHLLGFRARFPHAVQVRLVRDYRSTPQVVGLANRLVGAITPDGRALAVADRAGAPLVLEAQRPDGPAPVYRELPDETAEAQAVAARCRALIDAGTDPAEIAVLFRVNAQSAVHEQALTEAGVGYLVRGGERFFHRPEVREAVLLLRGAARSTAGDAGLVEAVTAVLSVTDFDRAAPPQVGGAVRDRWDSLEALLALAETMAASDPAAGLEAFVAELADREAHQHAPTVQGVTLASLHAAKGLEWDAVFLVGLVEGTLPLLHAQTPEQVAEERRLLYVGVTRAREHLWLSWALARQPGGRPNRQPSRFLDGLRPGTAGPTRTVSRSGPARLRAAVAAPLPDEVDAEMFDRLKAWRTARATADGVPPFVVFTDVTLQALAAVKPTDDHGLLSLPGIGPSRLARYGAAVRDVLAGGLGDVPAGPS